MNHSTSISPRRIAGIGRPISIEAGTGRCRLAHQLHNVEQAARSRVRKIALGHFKRSVEVAQMALMVQRLRNQHMEVCPDCGHQAAAGIPRNAA
jgi:hypothetical protein